MIIGRARHIKRGSTYRVLGIGRVCCAETCWNDDTKVHIHEDIQMGFLRVMPDFNSLGEHQRLIVTGHKLIGPGLLQVSGDLICEDVDVTIYRGEEDKKLWVRRVTEFNDGRFEALP